MKKIEVKKNGVVTHAGTFETQELVDAWVAKEIDNNSWGKPERWVRAEAEDISNALEQRVIQTEFETYTEYKLASEYTIEITDVTAEFEERSKIQKRTKKRFFGEYMIDKIAASNEAKNLTIEQIEAFMSDTTIFSLREHLWAGNIDTFITKLTASDVSAFFTTEEKAYVIAVCQAFLNDLEQ
ncbi:MAG TPA: hypothetical protein VFF49_04780 [Thermodesulfobacteriota bacterium]|nr:hypothetical protein [Thermodesulfobacteriota bacterium]